MNCRGDVRHRFALFLIVLIILWTGLTGFIAVARYQQGEGYVNGSSYTAVNYSNVSDYTGSGVDLWAFLGSVTAFAFSGEMLIIIAPLAAIIVLFGAWVILSVFAGMGG